MERTLTRVLVAAAIITVAADARAQKVGQVIPSLIEARQEIPGHPETTQALVNAPGPPSDATTKRPDHTAHFFQGSQAELEKAGALMNGAIATQFTTYPVGYSSGGFTYTFDPSTNTDRRTSRSFGPSFADRPLTIGRNRWNLALNYQRMTFDSLDGKDLKGDIHFYLPHNDCCGATPPGPDGGLAKDGKAVFEQDIMEATLSMELSANVVALSTTYGVTDRFDLGLAVPIISIDMNARLDTRLIRLGSEASATINNVPIHAFPGGSLVNPNPPTASASATGIGDIVIRGKYAFMKAKGGEAGAAVIVDLRLPTGDKENLLGTGTAQARFGLAASTAFGAFFPHVNLGYTVSGKGYVNELAPTLQQPDEANYTFGFDGALTSNVTVTADVVGRTLLDPSSFTDQTEQFPCVSCPPLTSSFQQFSIATGNTNLLFGTAGIRFNPARNLLISGNVLFPLRDAGLVDKLTPVIGLEYAF